MPLAGSRPPCFPGEKWLLDFDFHPNATINLTLIRTLTGGQWVADGKPLCSRGLRSRK
jgi:hypothetical protein